MRTVHWLFVVSAALFVSSQASGTLTAPFTGIHGWYWENSQDREVTVKLTAAGFFSLSHEFRGNAPVKNKTFP